MSGYELLDAVGGVDFQYVMDAVESMEKEAAAEERAKTGAAKTGIAKAETAKVGAGERKQGAEKRGWKYGWMRFAPVAACLCLGVGLFVLWGPGVGDDAQKEGFRVEGQYGMGESQKGSGEDRSGMRESHNGTGEDGQHGSGEDSSVVDGSGTEDPNAESSAGSFGSLGQETDGNQIAQGAIDWIGGDPDQFPYTPMISIYGESGFDFSGDMAVMNGGVFFSEALTGAMAEYGDAAKYRVLVELFCDGVQISSGGEVARSEMERLGGEGYTVAFETYFDGAENHYYFTLHATAKQLEAFEGSAGLGYALWLYGEYFGGTGIRY